MTKFFSQHSGENNLALETIDFQHNDPFAKNVEIEFSMIMEVLRNNPRSYRTINSHESVKAIEELTFKRMGIKIKLMLNGSFSTVLPFHPNEYSILLDTAIRGNVYGKTSYHKFLFSQEYKLIEKKKKKKGFVDIKTCKVSGIFSEYEAPMHINVRSMMVLGFTSAEITAAYLHELGHVFTAFEYSNRFNRTNQILAELLQKVIKKDNLPKEYIFKELKIINPKTTNDELDKIFNGKNIVLSRATLRFMKETIESQLSDDHYNQTTYETLADTFVARWGYGQDSVTGLKKMDQKTAEEVRDNRIIFDIETLNSVFTIAVMLMLMIGLVGVSVAGLTGIIVFVGPTFGSATLAVALLVGFMLGGYILAHGTYDNKMTYDATKYRYKRIRNQLIELIKNSDEIPKAQIKETITQISMLDKLINQTDEYKNIISLIVDFLTPGYSDSQDDIKTQRILEELSANDLYLRAASLRTV